MGRSVKSLIKSCLLACALALGLAGVAQAQNILILTTGGYPTPGNPPENNFMRGVIQEFAPSLDESICGLPPQTVPGPSGLSVTVTCNQTELGNGTALPASLFNPGYDLVVVAAAFKVIDSQDWGPLQTAIQNRQMRGAVFFVDTWTTNRTPMAALLTAALSASPAIGIGTIYGVGLNAHPLNMGATGASDFLADLPTFTMGDNYYPFTNVPAASALYLAMGIAQPVTTGTTTATGVFISNAASFGGNGACVFEASDMGWTWPNSATNTNNWGYPANVGKVGKAILNAFNDPAGPCAIPLASPPVLDIAKSTTADTSVRPVNNDTVPYTIFVSNTSTVQANNVAVTDSAPPGMSLGVWSCTVVNAGNAPASTCPVMPVTAGDLGVSVNLSGGAKLQFTVDASVTDGEASLTNVASLTLPAGAVCAGDRSPCNDHVDFAGEYTVIASVSGGGGTVDHPGTQSVTPGGNASFTLTPDPGKAPGIVSDSCAGSLAGNTYTSGPVESNCAVVFEFTNIPYTASASVTGGGGTVNPASQTGIYGDRVSFALTPAVGKAPVIASDTCGGALAGNAYTSAGLTGDCAVVFNFIDISYTASASVTGTGGTVAPASQTGIYGATVGFTLTPGPGKAPAIDTNTCGGALTGNTYTSAGLTGDCAVVFNFALKRLIPGADATAIPSLNTAGLLMLGALLGWLGMMGMRGRRA